MKENNKLGVMALGERSGFENISSNKIFFFVLFIFNPFLSFVFSIYQLYKRNNSQTRKWVYFLISLFLAFVAFTQYTKTGDISRIYEDIIESHSLFKSDFISFLLQSKHFLFDIINQVIYFFLRDVRYVSLFWIFILYYTIFLSIEDLAEYYKLESRIISSLAIVSVFCFVNFVEVTELMKQGVATSLFFYSYISLLVGRKVRGLLIFLLALNIHFTVLFFIPILLVKIVPGWIFFILLILSFSLRSVGLMEMLSTYIGQIPGVGDMLLIGSIAHATEVYQSQMDSFFQSTSPYFLFVFWSFFLISIVAFFYNRDNILVKACLVMLCVLNMSFSDNHNYTRLLTMLFPFYIGLYISIKSISIVRRRRIWTLVLVLCTFIISARFFFSKIGSIDYGTSYLDNSLINLISYPFFMYLL